MADFLRKLHGIYGRGRFRMKKTRPLVQPNKLQTILLTFLQNVKAKIPVSAEVAKFSENIDKNRYNNIHACK